MKDPLALRYLLLQEMWRLRDDVGVDLHREVARSLVVSRDGDRYTLSWSRGGVQRRTAVPRSDFELYVPGDRPGVHPRVDERTNERRIRDLARELLDSGTEPEVPVAKSREGRAKDVAGLLTGGVCVGGVALGAPLAALGIAGGLLAEGRFGAAGVLITAAGFYGSGLALAVLTGGLACSALGVLEPVPRRRRTLIATGLVMAVSAGFGAEPAAVRWAAIAGATLAAIVLSLPAHLVGTRRTVLPGLLPFFGVGAAGDGAFWTAGVLLVAPVLVVLQEVIRRSR